MAGWVGSPRKKERLHSWKEIADYLGRGVRTVQRWEREEELPVHRLTHQKNATLFALTAELDAWLAQRVDLAEKPTSPDEDAPRRNLTPWLAGAAGVLSLVAAASVWRVWREPSPSAVPLRVTPVTSYPGTEADPGFSPDGSRIAFTWSGNATSDPRNPAFPDLYVKLLGVEKPLRLTDRMGKHPAWSPDGQWIAFCRCREPKINNVQILVVPALGGPERVIGETIRPDLLLPRPYLTFTPDGKWLIAMDASGSGAHCSSLVLLSVESGEKRPLTKPPEGISDTAPALSPDGRTLAFVRGNVAHGNVYLLGLSDELTARGEPRQLTREKFPVGNPVWSADGLDVIYGSRDRAPPGLYRVPATGRGAGHAIPGTGMVTGNVAISRQGDRLAYSDHSTDADIWRTPLREAAPAAKFIASSRWDWFPQYSPDGTQVAFISLRSGSNELWVCHGDGTGAMQLTFLGARLAAQPGWSPDGKWIAFNSAVGGTYDLYIVPAAGGKPRRLTSEPGHDQSPVWSPDGKWIYFCSQRGGEFRVWRMPAEGGPATAITRNGGAQLQLSPDGKFVYYVATWKQPSLWRAQAEGGREEMVVDSIANTQAFAAGNDGIYYYRWQEKGRPALFLYRYATGRSERLPLAPVPDFYAPMGLTVSPDGRFLLTGRWFHAREGDILMVENALGSPGGGLRSWMRSLFPE